MAGKRALGKGRGSFREGSLPAEGLTPGANALTAERYRMLFELNPLPQWVYDAETLRFLIVNEAAVRHYGFGREEFPAMTIRDIHPEGDVEMLEATLRRQTTDSQHSGIWRHRKKSGEVIYVRASSSRVDWLGRPAVLVVAVDVTQQMDATATAAQLGQLLDESLNEIYVFDPASLRFTHVNQGARVNLGYSMKQLQLMTPLDIKPEFTREQFERLLAPLREGVERVVRFSTVHRRKDGSHYPIEVDLQLLPFGEKKRFVAVIRDLSEREAMMRSIRESEVRFRTAARATRDAIWDWDLATDQVVWGEGIGASFGYTDLGVGTSIDWWTEHIHPADRDRVVEGIHRVIDSTDSAWSDEYWFLCSDGNYAFVLDRGFVIREETGRAVRMVGAMMDQTERKRHEEQLRKLAAHLQAVREVERKEIARELHDELGHALTALNYNVAFLNKKFGHEIPEIREWAGRTSRQLDETVQVVRRISAELRPAVLDELGLAAAIEWLLRDFEARTNIRSVFSATGADEKLDSAISVAVFRICQESLTNVARHAKASRVEVSLAIGEEMVGLTVQDDGQGLDLEAIGPQALGLVGMRERAEAFGGKFEVLSRLGAGTLVSLKIPCRGASAGETTKAGV